jgi:outer membrane protein TolC
VDLTIPLYDGGYRSSKEAHARSELRAAEAELAAQQITVDQEVQDAERAVVLAEQQMRLATTLQTLAADAAASAQRSYEAGVASTLDVLDANDKLYQAEVGVANARAETALAELDRMRARGAGP